MSSGLTSFRVTKGDLAFTDLPLKRLAEYIDALGDLLGPTARLVSITKKQIRFRDASEESK